MPWKAFWRESQGVIREDRAAGEGCRAGDDGWSDSALSKAHQPAVGANVPVHTNMFGIHDPMSS